MKKLLQNKARLSPAVRGIPETFGSSRTTLIAFGAGHSNYFPNLETLALGSSFYQQTDHRSGETARWKMSPPEVPREPTSHHQTNFTEFGEKRPCKAQSGAAGCPCAWPISQQPRPMRPGF